MPIRHPVEQLIQDGLNQFNRGFFELLHPPLDAYWVDGNIMIKVDLPGYTPEQINVELVHNFLIIDAKRKSTTKVMEESDEEIEVIYEHRPLRAHARIPLPFLPKEDKEELQPCVSEVKVVNGVLIVKITNLAKNKVHQPQ